MVPLKRRIKVDAMFAYVNFEVEIVFSLTSIVAIMLPNLLRDRKVESV